MAIGNEKFIRLNKLGYTDYEVSNYGNVRKLKNGELLKIYTNSDGYKLVNIKISKGIFKTLFVHRLVASAFPDVCGEWFDNCIVDHLDTNPSNNNANNLRIGTSKDNNNNPITIKKLKFAKVHSRFKKGNIPWNKNKQLLQWRGENSVRSKSIIQFDRNGFFINEFSGINEASRQTNIKRTAISNCLNGLSSTSGGYK